MPPRKVKAPRASHARGDELNALMRKTRENIDRIAAAADNNPNTRVDCLESLARTIDRAVDRIFREEEELNNAFEMSPPIDARDTDVFRLEP